MTRPSGCAARARRCCHTAWVGKGQRVRAKRAAAVKQTSRTQGSTDQGAQVRAQLPRPNVTTFMSIGLVPVFPLEHPLGRAELPPEGSPGQYSVDAVLGVPGASRSAFEEIDWDATAAKGDSLIELAGKATSVTQSWHHGGPGGQQVIAYEFRLNADRRLATASTSLHAASFREALESAQDVLESYLSVMSFHHDVPAEAVAWRVTEEQTGTVHFAMKLLGKVKQLDTSLTLLSTPEFRELLSTWREAVNAATPMGQALGFYKIIERVHKYRVDREARTRDTAKHYLPPRETIPGAIQDLAADYEMMSEAFDPYLGKKFTAVWEQDLRERVRNAVAHLREDGPSLTPDRSADIEACRQAVPVLHYMTRTMLQRELADEQKWPMQ